VTRGFACRFLTKNGDAWQSLEREGKRDDDGVRECLTKKFDALDRGEGEKYVKGAIIEE